MPLQAEATKMEKNIKGEEGGEYRRTNLVGRERAQRIIPINVKRKKKAYSKYGRGKPAGSGGASGEKRTQVGKSETGHVSVEPGFTHPILTVKNKKKKKKEERNQKGKRTEKKKTRCLPAIKS